VFKTKIASRADLLYAGAFGASIMAMVVAASAVGLLGSLVRPPFPTDAVTIDHYNLMLATVGIALTALVFGALFVPFAWALVRMGAKLRPSATRRGALVATALSVGYLLVASNSIMFAWTPTSTWVWDDIISIAVAGIFYPLAWWVTSHR
jgi:hypothetical protein